MSQTPQSSWQKIERHFRPPADVAGRLGNYRPIFRFGDGSDVRSAEDWQRRRAEIPQEWMALMGPWPALLERPRVEHVGAAEGRDGLRQQRVRIQVSDTQWCDGYVLLPEGTGPFPAVLVVYYEPETSVGLKPDYPQAAFGYELAKRGFVTLSVGSPPMDAREPDMTGLACQPLSYLAYVAANCHTALAQMPQVDAQRIGVVGHSYGGKWSLFAGCLYEKFAACAVSDPGIVFDESRPNVNYWDRWYLGYDPTNLRQRGNLSADNPRTGVYKTMIERGMDLHELHALLSPRPLLVSGGSEDPPERWVALNHTVAVNKLLGYEGRVGMTNRPDHTPSAESNEVIYSFFEHFLKAAPAGE